MMIVLRVAPDRMPTPQSKIQKEKQQHHHCQSRAPMSTRWEAKIERVRGREAGKIKLRHTEREIKMLLVRIEEDQNKEKKKGRRRSDKKATTYIPYARAGWRT